MIIGIIRLVPGQGKRDEILEILRSVQRLVTTDPACLACDIYEEHGDSYSILFFESWETNEDLTRHIASPHYTRLLQTLELACQKPLMVFHEVSESRGLELVEAVRARNCLWAVRKGEQRHNRRIRAKS